jgi:uncharacterized surface protein with fasciclin (FAS1) repeats
MSQFVRRSVVLFVVATTLAACGGGTAATTAESPATTEAMTETTETMSSTTEAMVDEMGDVLEVAAAEGDLNSFLAALEAGGIMEDFHGEGPFTLFVPTDDAFAAYFADTGMTQEEAFAGGEMLTALLSYHFLNMEDDSAMVMEMAGDSLTTASGEALDVTIDGETVMVGNATVERYDLHASNGVVHVIDAVLVPPSMQG